MDDDGVTTRAVAAPPGGGTLMSASSRANMEQASMKLDIGSFVLMMDAMFRNGALRPRRRVRT